MQTRGRQIEATKKEYIGYEQMCIRIPSHMIDYLNTLPRWNKGEFVRQAIQEKIDRGSK